MFCDRSMRLACFAALIFLLSNIFCAANEADDLISPRARRDLNNIPGSSKHLLQVDSVESKIEGNKGTSLRSDLQNSGGPALDTQTAGSDKDTQQEAISIQSQGNPQFLPKDAGDVSMQQHAGHSGEQASQLIAEEEWAVRQQGPANAVETSQEPEQKPESRPHYPILAVVSTYKDDIAWVLAEDRGGNDWLWRVPTELYQVADITHECKPTFPGLFHHHEVTPEPSWPEWAASWVLEKCAVQREGITPGSVLDSQNMAAIDAGLMETPNSQQMLLEEGITKDSISGTGVVLFEKLTPLPLHLVPNKASESLGYLTAIIEHYEDLPDLLLCMHGHQKSWHTLSWGQDWMLDRLATLPPRNLTSSDGYMQLGCIQLDDHANRVFPTIIGANHWSPTSLGPRWHESFAAHFTQAWIEHLGQAFGQPRPPPYI